MSELERLNLIRRSLPPLAESRVVHGLGDDCAIVRAPGSSEEWLISTDLLVEDVHFRSATHSAGDIGYKALARGLSDLAAMGAQPRFCLVSLAMPPRAGDDWLAAFYDGIGALAAEAGAPVIGGDLSAAAQFVCDIVVCGSAPPNTAMRRDRARPGDLIYVSGLLGASVLGLETREGEAWRRHLRPRPRLRLGEYLRSELGVRAAMDLSDGLSIDLHRLASESGVAAVIDRPLPIYPGASEEQALHGGEDYEILFTISHETGVPESYEELPLRCIGRIEAGVPGTVSSHGQPVAPRGWDHFNR